MTQNRQRIEHVVGHFPHIWDQVEKLSRVTKQFHKDLDAADESAYQWLNSELLKIMNQFVITQSMFQTACSDHNTEIMTEFEKEELVEVLREYE